MPAVALIAGANVVTGIIGAGAAQSAAKTQAAAENQAANTQLTMFDQTQANLQPFTDVGKSATYTLADLYGLPTPTNPNGGQPYNPASLAAFTNSPDYQFAQQQGIAGLDQSAASKGGLLSGNQLEAITNYSSGLATQNFGNYVTRLSDLAGLGESAGAQQGSASQAAANGISSAQVGAGQATASGTVGAYNSLAGGVNNGINNYLTLSRLQMPTPSSYSVGTGGLAAYTPAQGAALGGGSLSGVY